MANIKGSKLSSKLAFVRRRFGDSMVDRVIEALPADDRLHMRDLIDLRWYPAELYDRLVQTICRVAAGGDENVYDTIGADSAEHQLSNIYAAFRGGDLQRMLRNMVPMHSHLNDPGHMEIDTPHDGECTITVTEPKSTLIDCRISRSFYRRVAELAGAQGVRVDERTCTARGQDACRFLLQWAH